MKISTRLAIGFSALSGLIVVVGSVALWKVSAVNAQFDLALRDRYPKIMRFEAIKADNEVIARSIRNALLMTDPSAIKQQLSQIDDATRRLDAEFDVLSHTMATPGGIALMKKLQSQRNEYDALLNHTVEVLKAGHPDEARVLLLDQVRPKQIEYTAGADALITLGGQNIDAAGAQADAEVTAAYSSVAAGVVTALGLAAILGTLIVRATTRPLARAVGVARGVAAGDLTATIEGDSNSETGQLLEALDDMQSRLHSIVSSARATAESVATAAAQIASGNVDLSSRTEEQASALQQTASAMEELNVTVRSNADSAVQANQLAMAASTVAEAGGVAVNEVVKTMRGISESSRMIADITGLIDGIAFQTNILALNAAVEAARAGEQGRGFAVVAAEVRSLAQRSAEAAKQIAGLIATSVERVEIGTAQAARAGSTIEGVVNSIRRVTDIVGEISAASAEQSVGVGQIGQAVSQMDQATQQNAALVEESAAAAESLRSQAKLLVASMAVFKLVDLNGEEHAMSRGAVASLSDTEPVQVGRVMLRAVGSNIPA